MGSKTGLYSTELTLFLKPRPVIEFPCCFGFDGELFDFPKPTLFLRPRPDMDDMFTQIRYLKQLISQSELRRILSPESLALSHEED